MCRSRSHHTVCLGPEAEPLPYEKDSTLSSYRDDAALSPSEGPYGAYQGRINKTPRVCSSWAFLRSVCFAQAGLGSADLSEARAAEQQTGLSRDTLKSCHPAKGKTRFAEGYPLPTPMSERLQKASAD